MKTLKRTLTIAIMVALVSCATTVKFPVSQIAPAAEGQAKIKQDRNENYKIELSVKHLAEPERLNPPSNQYIVWTLDENGSYQNIGRIVPDRRNSASLDATTPFRPVQILITAESMGNPTWPGRQILFRSDNFKVR